MKQIKEIFRRSTSRWLALELILVTFTLWWAFDPVIVTNYVTHLPLGYDVDRMVKLDVAILTEGIAVNELSNEEERLLQKVQEIDEVELAYRAHNNPMGYNTITMPGFFFNDKGDSIQTQRYGFIQDSKMFEVYGIHSLTPSVPDNELTHDCEWEKTVIFTHSLAIGLFGTIDVAGRNVLGMKYGWDEASRTMGWHKEYFHIRAVVEDVRYQTYDRNYATLFYCTSGVDSGIPIILRLREGVNTERFVQEHQKEILNEMETEHCYIRSIQTASEAKDKQYGSIVLERLTRRNLLIAAFFATNMAFGVLGTLLMYMQQRREEAGVRDGASSGVSFARRGCLPPSASSSVASSTSSSPPRRASLPLARTQTPPCISGSTTSARTSWSCPSSFTLLYYVPSFSAPSSLPGASAAARLRNH